jgi:hypothetical protein
MADAVEHVADAPAGRFGDGPSDIESGVDPTHTGHA